MNRTKDKEDKYLSVDLTRYCNCAITHNKHWRTTADGLTTDLVQLSTGPVASVISRSPL